MQTDTALTEIANLLRSVVENLDYFRREGKAAPAAIVGIALAHIELALAALKDLSGKETNGSN